ncbi:MAG: SIR2 family NAD-dependent protein deacylase [Prevotella sp.]|jgi:NAD-dependent SIR2 family protein deacetylase
MKTRVFLKDLFQQQPKVEFYDERISKAADAIRQADYVLIGAGAGLSTAAGLRYDGEEFQEEFRPWIEKYGITDLYSSSFYPWRSEEERWAYWAKHINFIRFRPGATPLYRALFGLVNQKDYFVITTNVDAQFEKAGFDRHRIFAVQGDYGYLQSITGMPRKLYYNEDLVERMVAHTNDCRIPSVMVPHCPDNGELMTPNIRVDDTFVEDDNWHRQSAAYYDFLKKAENKRLVLLEFGVGFNTPSIIRLPFEQMAHDFGHTTLVRFNKDECFTLLNGFRSFIPVSERLDVELIESLSHKVNARQETTVVKG